MGFAGSIADMAIYDRYGDVDAVDAYNEAYSQGADDVVEFFTGDSSDSSGDDGDDGYGETIDQARIDGYAAGVADKFAESGVNYSDISDEFTDWSIARSDS